MLVQDVMTRNVITVTPDTSIGEAQKIMKEHNFRRLPVVDSKGRLMGVVTEPRLEKVKPRTSAPLLWQITYLISHTTVTSVMRKKIITVKPDDTVEHAIATAQAAKVGTLIVVDRGKVVGICTTNDFFYKIVNPTLGIGETGTRILIRRGGGSKSAEKIISAINKLGITIKLIWTSASSLDQTTDLTLELETDDATKVIEELANLGFEAKIRQR